MTPHVLLSKLQETQTEERRVSGEASAVNGLRGEDDVSAGTVIPKDQTLHTLTFYTVELYMQENLHYLP